MPDCFLTLLQIERKWKKDLLLKHLNILCFKWGGQGVKNEGNGIGDLAASGTRPKRAMGQSLAFV